MGSICIDLQNVLSLSEKVGGESTKISRCESAVQSVRSGTDRRILARRNLSSRLSQAQSALDALERKVADIGRVMGYASNQYRQTDTRLANEAKEFHNPRLSSCAIAGGNAQAFKGMVADTSGSEGLKIGSKINDVLGEMGYLGNVLAFFTKPIATWIDSGTFQIGVTGASTVTSLIKDGNSTLKGLYEWSKSNDALDKLARMLPERAKEVRIKRLFGLNDMFAGQASQAWKSPWSTRFYNNFHKMKSPFESYTSGGAKAAFAWVGLGLTAISNTISNIDEHESGKISTKRAVAETVTETVVDVGKGWLIGTAVAAGVAATVGSAPVLAVGALTVGVSVGLDWACKKITGAVYGEEKGLTETVSDFVLDVGEATISVGKKAVTSIVSNVKSGWSNLKSSFKHGFTPLLST